MVGEQRDGVVLAACDRVEHGRDELAARARLTLLQLGLTLTLTLTLTLLLTLTLTLTLTSHLSPLP